MGRLLIGLKFLKEVVVNFSNYISNGLGLQRTNNYRLTSFSMSALRFDCSYGECSLGWDTTSCKTIVRLECCRHTFHKECAIFFVFTLDHNFGGPYGDLINS